MNNNRRRNFRARSQKNNFRRRNGSISSNNPNNFNNGNVSFNRNGSMNNLHNVEKIIRIWLKYKFLYLEIKYIIKKIKISRFALSITNMTGKLIIKNTRK